jgi:T4 RnlA family RNA ligase
MTNYKETFDELVEEGWLISQTHPFLDLTIYNYSQKTQYEGYWTLETLAARGLVLNSSGEIVARPFGKFFNISEAKNEIPNLPFEVFEKLDGSLGIAFYYKDELVFASRGSFTSEQAIKGRELLDKYNHEYGMYPGYTYLFEIIYPGNRIVIDYEDMEELIVIGVIETKSGRECSFEAMTSEGFKIVKKYDFDDYATIQNLNWENKEGFVVRFSNGFRVKIKFEEYVRLHRIVTQISTIDIWEKLKNNEPLDEILERVPDEFFDWVRETAKDLTIRYENIQKDYMNYFLDITKKVVATNRKDFAEEARKYSHPNLLFNLLDGKDLSQTIWKIIKPKWSKPFKRGDT